MGREIGLSVEIALVTAAIVVIVLLVAGLILWWHRHKRETRLGAVDEMEGHDFEHFCADLLSQQGFLDAEVTRGSGDYGIDVLAEKDGVTYAIQCKRYSGPVGVDAVLRAYAGRDFYDRMVGVVMTNQYFTQPAVTAAKKLRILLWDRGYLDEMMQDNER